MARKDLNEDTLRIECPLCHAPQNRRCVRLMNPSKGGPTRNSHQPRIEAYFKYELQQNPPLAEIPFEELKQEMIVRCRESGRFGKIAYLHHADTPSMLITFGNGCEQRIIHKNATKLLQWREKVSVQ